MKYLLHLPTRVSLLIGAAAGALLWLLLFGRPLNRAAADLLPAPPDAHVAGAALRSETAVAPGVLHYLENEFCAPDLCPDGTWSAWIILTPDNAWTVAELQTVRRTLLTTRAALNSTGFDGQALLAGYRFRNVPRIYLNVRRGVLGRVLHDSHEIILADGALQKQWGFYLYHELGHIVDLRLDRLLTREFNRRAAGGAGAGSSRTADGFWLDSVARENHPEATADAFALWIMLYHTDDPRPVFWNKPHEASFAAIAAVLDNVLRHIAPR